MDFVGNYSVGEKQSWVSEVSERIHVSAQCIWAMPPIIMQSAFIAKDGLKTLFYHPPHPSSKYVCPCLLCDLF